ncbi:hypothetical protein ACFYT5_23355 [Streptomyces anulatus]|uniref:hypothetical protein n=1 Tax=Streptomyces anulatus TaxID=1892 RepID=UPI00369568A6
MEVDVTIAGMDAESLFVDLYDAVADEADYVQSDSEVRNFLAEATITALVAATVSAFVAGLTQALGDAVKEGTLSRIRGLLRRSADAPADAPTGRVELTVEALRLLDQYLPLLRNSTSEQRAAEERWVAAELEGRGFPPHVAECIAADMVGRLRAEAEEQ